MAGTRSNNTMSEGMIGLLQQLAVMKAAPDADMEALSGMESQILQVINKPRQQAMEHFAAAGGVVPGGAPPPSPGGQDMGALLGGALGGGMGMPPGGGMPMAPPSPEPPRGGRQAPGTPPGDELRRLLSSRSMA